MYKYDIINIFTIISLYNLIMRATFIAPLTHHFDDVFPLQTSRDIRGGRLNTIQIYQTHGGSLFGIIGGLFKSYFFFEQ